MDLCRANERAWKHLDHTQIHEPKIDLVKTKSSKWKAKQKSSKSSLSDSETFSCSSCENDHVKKSCPAYKKKCVKCNIPGHFSKMCRSKVRETYMLLKHVAKLKLMKMSAKTKSFSSMKSRRKNIFNCTSTK